MASLPPETAEAILYDWRIFARDAQLPPPGDWIWWLILAGRGFGKTRSGSEFVLARVASGTARNIALIGPTAADVRDTMVEIGPGSILKNCAPSNRPDYEPSKRRLTWANGAVATTFSADEPERFRGPGFDLAWCDELGAWKHQRDTWDMIQFGFREGTPQGIITTTPRPTPVVRELVEDAEGESPTVIITRGSTFDNSANLARRYLGVLLKKYEGTRLGLQELHAKLLGDTPGALWTLTAIEADRVKKAPELKRIVVAIDPPGGVTDPGKQAARDAGEELGAECGIVAAGVGEDGHGYVIADRSGRCSPNAWGERAVLLFDELEADAIVGETNHGGEMVEAVTRNAARDLHQRGKRTSAVVPFRAVHASRGKQARAEPIAALSEQHRTHHVGCLAALEDQMTTWDASGKAASPDRLDALVWALWALMIDGGPPASYNAAAKSWKATAPQPDTDARPSRRERLRDRSDR